MGAARQSVSITHVRESTLWVGKPRVGSNRVLFREQHQTGPGRTRELRHRYKMRTRSSVHNACGGRERLASTRMQNYTVCAQCVHGPKGNATISCSLQAQSCGRAPAGQWGQHCEWDPRPPPCFYWVREMLARAQTACSRHALTRKAPLPPHV